jgi:hypothetical protein
MDEEFESFEDFWPYYVSRHRNAANRALHFAGTTLAVVCLAGALSSRQWLLLAVVSGYGSAWLGHLVFERGLPVSLRHPFWSLRGDARMYGRMLAGTLRPDLEKAARLYASPEETERPEAPAPAEPGPDADPPGQDDGKPSPA